VQLDPTAFVADPDLIAALTRNAAPVACASERILFLQGDAPIGLYILRNGDVRLTMDSLDGRPLVSVQAPAGSLLGLPGLLGNQPYTLTAIAEPGAIVHFIPEDEFKALMQSEPQLSLKILAVLAAEVRSARRAIG